MMAFRELKRLYQCPMTKIAFQSHENHCLDNPPCLYFNSIKKVGEPKDIVIICEYPEQSPNQKEAES